MILVPQLRAVTIIGPVDHPAGLILLPDEMVVQVEEVMNLDTVVVVVVVTIIHLRDHSTLVEASTFLQLISHHQNPQNHLMRQDWTLLMHLTKLIRRFNDFVIFNPPIGRREDHPMCPVIQKCQFWNHK